MPPIPSSIESGPLLTESWSSFPLQLPDTPDRQVARQLHRIGAGYALVVAHGEQPVDRWLLPTDRPATIGRQAGPLAPDVDLHPDRRASREHARIWSADHFWWIEDTGSKHGTRVEGRMIEARQPTVLLPWSEIRIGDTTLFLAPPGWRRVRARDVVLDLEIVGAVSPSLVQAGLPIVRRMVARSRDTVTRPPGHVEIALRPCFGPVRAEIPALPPGASAALTLPTIAPSYDVLEGQVERSRRRLMVTIDEQTQRGEPIECWLLPYNEWSTLPEHRQALATFVLPNHPSVSALASEVMKTADPDATVADVFGTLFEVLAQRWQLAYRLEPPHWSNDSQKIRLPHEVLADDGGRHGEGTCLDLVLLVAACLENLGLQPLVAVVDVGEWWHALVGCWDPAAPGLESLLFDSGNLLNGAIWVDPTCATRDERMRRPFDAARLEAERYLADEALIFALDVVAARREEIMPLPYAGLPSWSGGVAGAIEAANVQARRVGGQVCSAALLAGLLLAGDGLTSDLVGASIGDPAQAAQTIVAALPLAPPAEATSAGYRQVLDIARSRAKLDGSPMVLEVHLLGAILALRSTSLDRALGRLGSSQQHLARSLFEMDGGTGRFSARASGWY